MKKFVDHFRANHEFVYKIVLFVASVVLIVYQFPKEAQFKYEYQKNRIWSYEDLHAEFDFTILRPQHEIDSITRYKINNKSYYFLEKPEIGDNIKDNYRTLFEEQWASAVENIPEDAENYFNRNLGSNRKRKKNEKRLKKLHLEIGQTILTTLFRKGIIQIPKELIDKPSNYLIYVAKKQGKEKTVIVTQSKELKEFNTIKLANDFIYKSLSSYPNIDANFLGRVIDKSLGATPHNIVFDLDKTNKMLQEKLKNTEFGEGVVQNTILIRKGENIDAKKFNLLTSYEEHLKKQRLGKNKENLIYAGQILLVTITLGSLAIFLILFRKEIFVYNRNVVFILILINLMVLFTSSVIKADILNYNIVPYCIIPIIIRAFFDTRTALFTHFTNILISGFIVPSPFQFVFIQFIAGMGAIFGYVNMRKRSQLFVASAIIFFSYSLGYFGLSIVQEGDITQVDVENFAWFAGSAGLTLITYPLIYAFEKVFGFISEVTLLELSDTNSELLRKLALVAPGTFQHSMQVANLAEAAIYQIGGNTLLVRAGALYHDIGKMTNAHYFIENQATGVNPHDELPYMESSKIIVSHVIDGVELAKKHKLPDQIIDFIRTHHGNSITQYFYRKYMMENPDDEDCVEKFQYPGPVPFSKETAVLMMADSVEAASRSLKVHDVQTIDNLVENIINSQITEGQFENADITFKNIKLIKKIFKKMLMNIYHVRVEYPH